MFKKTSTIITTIFALLFISSYALALKIGEAAPNFTLKDSHGKTHSLSDFKGKYVVLEWINFGCPFVKKHYKSDNMQKLQKNYTGKDVVWLSICSSAEGKQGNFDSDEINKKIKEYESVQTAYLIDENGDIGHKYEAKTTPHMYIIDPKGKLAYVGAIDDIKSTDPDDVKDAKNYVMEALDAALSGKDILNSTTKPYGCSVKYKSK